jgi:hypothetical protein
MSTHGAAPAATRRSMLAKGFGRAVPGRLFLAGCVPGRLFVSSYQGRLTGSAT